MNKHHAERAYLLYLARSGISRRRPTGLINWSNYAAVYTQPSPCPTPFYGPCLIWRHRLDTHGYGTLQLNRKPQKAHRVAYEMTRAEIPEGNLILHLCHRRSCVQPAHLYAGTRKRNAEDRKVRLYEEGGRASIGRFMEEYTTRMYDGMKYYWDEPPEVERTLFQQQIGEHCCVYTIPAGVYSMPDGKVGEIKLCQVCFEQEIEWSGNCGHVDPREEETANRAGYRYSLAWFFEGRGPGDRPLNIVPGSG